MGRVTIIIENAPISTKDLEKLGHEAMSWLQDEARDRYGVEVEDIFVVPSDEEPYNGPDYPPGTNAGLP